MSKFYECNTCGHVFNEPVNDKIGLACPNCHSRDFGPVLNASNIVMLVMAVLAIITLVVMSCGAKAEGRFWSDDKGTNTAIITANALLVVDWAQTRYIADNPNYHEQGWAKEFIGAHPATSEVNRYFRASLILVNSLGYFLPERATLFGRSWNPKKSLYIGVSVFEGVQVYQNAKIGIRLDF